MEFVFKTNVWVFTLRWFVKSLLSVWRKRNLSGNFGLEVLILAPCIRWNSTSLKKANDCFKYPNYPFKFAEDEAALVRKCTKLDALVSSYSGSVNINHRVSERIIILIFVYTLLKYVITVNSYFGKFVKIFENRQLSTKSKNLIVFKLLTSCIFEVFGKKYIAQIIKSSQVRFKEHTKYNK